MKTLVVDNDPLFLEIAGNILQQEGHDVMTADSGLSAIDLFSDHHFDFIFIDYIMPQVDGKALCKIIRAIPFMKEARIVVLSAIAAEESIDLLKIGAHACIAKGPVEEMAVNIRSVMRDLKQGWDPARSGVVYGLKRRVPGGITSELLSVKIHFELMLDAMSEGVVEVNRDDRVVYSNPAATAMIGRPEKDVLGAKLHEIFPDGTGERLKRQLHLNQVCGGKIRLKEPVQIGEKSVGMTFIRLESESGGQIVILNDVTANIHLEAQLRQSQKMEAIGTLAGGIAHDFNNLLMGLQGKISLMMYDVSESSPAFHHLKQMERYIESGSGLTRQLLGFARKGKYVIKPRDTNEIVEQSLEMFGRTNKGIHIRKLLGDRLWSIEADRTQVEQVLLNIFVNAVQAMGDAGRLTVETKNRYLTDGEAAACGLSTGKYVVISISDTGIGMDRETRERIFDPFFTTKRRGRGTGLGLASAYGIVKNHRGNILVDSEPGAGASFSIYLPGSEKPPCSEVV